MSLYAKPTVTETFKAFEDMAAYRVVKRHSATEVELSDTDDEEVIGITLTEATAGQDVDVALLGLCPVKCGGAISAGNKLASNGGTGTDGSVKAAAPAQGNNSHVLGIALDDGVLNDEIVALVSPSVMQGA